MRRQILSFWDCYFAGFFQVAYLCPFVFYFFVNKYIWNAKSSFLSVLLSVFSSHTPTFDPRLHSHVITFYADVTVLIWLGSTWPIEKQTNSLKAPGRNQLNTGSRSTIKLAPGSFCWKRPIRRQRILPSIGSILSWCLRRAITTPHIPPTGKTWLGSLMNTTDLRASHQPIYRRLSLETIYHRAELGGDRQPPNISNILSKCY